MRNALLRRILPPDSQRKWGHKWERRLGQEGNNQVRRNERKAPMLRALMKTMSALWQQRIKSSEYDALIRTLKSINAQSAKVNLNRKILIFGCAMAILGLISALDHKKVQYFRKKKTSFIKNVPRKLSK